MPAATAAKRVLGDLTDARAKKRKVEAGAYGTKREDRIAKLSQKKSSFEGDLEKLTQELHELKEGMYSRVWPD